MQKKKVATGLLLKYKEGNEGPRASNLFEFAFLLKYIVLTVFYKVVS